MQTGYKRGRVSWFFIEFSQGEMEGLRRTERFNDEMINLERERKKERKRDGGRGMVNSVCTQKDG